MVKAHAFEATIRRIDINPYVRVPATVVRALLSESNRNAAPVPVTGSLYRRKEILRYLGGVKRAETLERNIAKAMAHLRGETVTGLVAITR